MKRLYKLWINLKNDPNFIFYKKNSKYLDINSDYLSQTFADRGSRATFGSRSFILWLTIKLLI
jgi:hypothetical protein